MSTQHQSTAKQRKLEIAARHLCVLRGQDPDQPTLCKGNSQIIGAGPGVRPLWQQTAIEIIHVLTILESIDHADAVIARETSEQSE